MPTKKLRSMKAVIGVLFAAALLLGACGSDSKDKTAAKSTSKTTEAPSTTAKPAAGDAPVTVKMTSLGNVLVGKTGMTVYGFTKDTEGKPTCAGPCADAWPAVLTDSADLPAGLDPKVFSVVPSLDGTFQIKAGAWPLYYFANDKAAGDVNGQGIGGIWYVVDAKGQLVKEAKPAAGKTDDSTTTTDDDSGY
jgi:predicted lipoprotein with Yx(FWY)xxD motif